MKKKRVSLTQHIEAPIHKTALESEQQRLFCNGIAIVGTPPVPKGIWCCPYCGTNHSKSHKSYFTDGYICSKCRNRYTYPRQGTVYYTPPDVMSKSDRTYVENPDWVK